MDDVRRFFKIMMELHETGKNTSGGVPVKQCRLMIQKGLEHPKAKFLMEEMEKFGCSINPRKFFKTAHCHQRAGGNFVKGRGIRANVLSGDCHYVREFLRGQRKLRGHEPVCIKRKASASVRANPNCSEAMADNAVDAVWETCYNDTKPFDKAP